MQRWCALSVCLVLVGGLIGCGSGGSSSSSSFHADPEEVFKQQIKLVNELADALKTGAPDARVAELREQLEKNKKSWEQVISGDSKTRKAIMKKYQQEFGEAVGKLAAQEAIQKMKKN
jgi:hypothetical protein